MLNTDLITDVVTVYADPTTAGNWYPPGTVVRYVTAEAKAILIQRSDATGDLVDLTTLGDTE